ncbi:MAG: phytanoyl-CoA dioxygenase family protein [Spirochaetaceae bacterium]|nr:phytanoyl-CoA dioxygenase family protein [Spirochaetaceae bacterium]
MTLEQMRQRMYVDGWCVIEDVIPPSDIDDVHDSVLRTVDTYKHTRKNAPANIGAVSGMIVYDQSFAPYLAEPRLLGLAESLLGTDLRISFNSSIVNYPGNERSQWHADWPFNQKNAGHIPAPYPDAVCHLTTLWMLTDFTEENGGTLIVSGSHRSSDNPSGGVEVPPFEPYPTEVCVTGRPGSVVVCDSRLWHAAGANRSTAPRVGLAVRYAPWWLNLEVLRPGSPDRQRILDANPDLTENEVPPVPRDVFEGLPPRVQPLFQHWVAA